jgi:hypothetical protein
LLSSHESFQLVTVLTLFVQSPFPLSSVFFVSETSTGANNLRKLDVPELG